MTSLIWNLIEINIVVIILFAGYLAIRNRLSFKQQRGVLIGMPFLAIAAILIKSLVDFSAVSYSIPIVKLEPIFVGQTPVIVQASETSLSLTFMYGIGSLCIGLLLVFRLCKLGLFFARNKAVRAERYWIYKVDGKSSFSFFNRIQITPSLSAIEQEIVLEHEKMHADKWHSVDIIIVELLHVAFWFNPIFFFIKRELINLHEFEVDALMYKKHKVGYMKFLVNYALGLTTSNYLLTSRFYNRLTLKKRIKTMKTNYKKRSWILGLIPLTAVSVILIQCTKEDLGADTGNQVNPEGTLSQEAVLDGMDYLENSEQGGAAYFEKVWSGFEEGKVPFFVHELENMHYPEEAIANQEEGTVTIEFIVTENGEIENAWVKEGVSESLDREALRLVSTAPYFEPTIVNGKPVRAKYWAPVVFKLENAESINEPREPRSMEWWTTDDGEEAPDFQKLFEAAKII